MAGRKTKCTLEMIANAGKLAQVTVEDESLADALGISPRTFYSWRARGEREKARLDDILRDNPDAEPEPDPSEDPYLQFLQATNRGREKALDAIEKAMMREALSNGNLALRILARRRPKTWAQRYQHEVTGKDGGPVQVDGGLEAAQQLADEIRSLVEQAGALEPEDASEGADGD